VEPPPPGPAEPRVGALAPEITIDRWWLGRGRDTLEAYRGSYVVLHFIAPTCNNCARTIMALNDLHERFGKMDTYIIGIARVVEREPEWKVPANAGGGRAVKTGDTAAAMGEFIRAARPRYPVAVDRDGITMGEYRVQPRATEWHMSSSGAVLWRDHTLRGEHGETCFLIGRNGAVLWAGEGGDEALERILRSRIKDDLDKKNRYEAWLQQRVSEKMSGERAE